MTTKVEERVDSLEKIMKDLAHAQLESDRKIRELSVEMKVFKDEMKVFKDEMIDFKDEMRNEVKRINKQWGDLANKMGTVAEDIVAPNIPRIAKDYFNCEKLEDFSIRRRVINKKDDSKMREFDVIAKCKDIVIINETKSTIKTEYIDEYIKLLEQIFDYFPEYKGLKIIPIFSSFLIPYEVVNYLTKNKIYAMAMKDDTMDILNPELKV